MTRQVHDQKYYQRIHDLDVCDMPIATAVEEIKRFTNPINKRSGVAFSAETRVAYILIELDTRDAAHAEELQQALASVLGRRFFASMKRPDKPGHCWLMAVCTPGALLVKSKK